MSPPSANFQPRVSHRWCTSPWLPVAVGLLCYLSSLPNGFTYDDVALIVENPRIQSLTNLKAIWLSDWWFPESGLADAAALRDRLYRPLTLFTFALNYAAHNLDPLGYHLVNVLLHAGASGLVWVLTRRLLGRTDVATIAALVFAVHPVHAEAVANVVGRAEVLATVFLLLGLIILLPRGDSLPGPLRTAFAAFIFFIALLAKETAISFPAIALLALYLRRLQLRPLNFWLTRAILLVWPLLIYFPLRYAALGQRLTRDENTAFLLNPLLRAVGIERLTGALTVLGHYTCLLFAPATLSSDYGYAVIDPGATLTPLTILGLLTTIAIVITLAGFLRPSTTWRQLATLTAIFLASYALISNTLILIGVAVAERLLYWPSVPFTILVGLVLVTFWQRYCTPGQPLAHRTRLLQILGIALLVALTARTAIRNLDWHDNLTLMERDVRTYPQSAHLNYGYAFALTKQATATADADTLTTLLRRADHHLTRAITIEPALPDALALRARVRADLGQREAARTDAEAALLLSPTHGDARAVLSHLVGGTPEQTAAELEQLAAAAAEIPDDFAAQFAYGRALLTAGQAAAARAPLEQAVKLQPENVEALERLGQVLTITGHDGAAIDTFQRVLTLDPDHWQTHSNLAQLLAPNHPAAAIRHARRAVELNPSDLRLHVNLAEAHAAAGDRAAAVSVYNRMLRSLPPDAPFREVIQQRIDRLTRE